MSPEIKKIPARFYRNSSGREPVREWLKALEAGDRKIIGQDIATVESGNLILLHGFIKKTQRTPKTEMAIARHRMWEVIP